ncbi:TPA: hypothetical protein ACGOSV_000940 [Streptococcus suis]
MQTLEEIVAHATSLKKSTEKINQLITETDEKISKFDNTVFDFLKHKEKHDLENYRSTLVKEKEKNESTYNELYGPGNECLRNQLNDILEAEFSKERKERTSDKILAFKEKLSELQALGEELLAISDSAAKEKYSELFPTEVLQVLNNPFILSPTRHEGISLSRTKEFIKELKNGEKLFNNW